MPAIAFKKFSAQENATWRSLYERLNYCRANQAAAIFVQGLEKICLDPERVPDLMQVNQRLSELTGWTGAPSLGLLDNEAFFQSLTMKQFPVGNFIRDSEDLNYTPAPDVFHDLYGHLPFFANVDYASFCEEFGKRASLFAGNEKAIELWGRLFWFGVEFPLVRTKGGTRIFGGGILSSFGESNYALSGKPELLPFDPAKILQRSYRIDQMQSTLFVLEEPEQLYSCLPEYEALVKEAMA